MKKILLIIALCSTVLYIWSDYTLKEEITAIRERYERQSELKQVDSVTLEKKVIELKKKVVDDIFTCEGLELGEDYALITFDPQQSKKSSCSKIGSRNKDCFSFGLGQFKLSTIIYYNKELYNKELTNKEALEIAMSEEKAKELAEDIIFEEVGGIFNWKNCEAKTNSAEKIEIIRTLMK